MHGCADALRTWSDSAFQGLGLGVAKQYLFHVKLATWIHSCCCDFWHYASVFVEFCFGVLLVSSRLRPVPDFPLKQQAWLAPFNKKLYIAASMIRLGSWSIGTIGDITTYYLA